MEFIILASFFAITSCIAVKLWYDSDKMVSALRKDVESVSRQLVNEINQHTNTRASLSNQLELFAAKHNALFTDGEQKYLKFGDGSVAKYIWKCPEWTWYANGTKVYDWYHIKTFSSEKEALSAYKEDQRHKEEEVARMTIKPIELHFDETNKK